MSLALHLYDEEPDILGSFSTKDIMEVRACNDKEEAETGNCKSACVITLRPQSSSAGDVIQAVSDRMIVSSNGKLELKKNAATGYWGSVNRIASLSRHQSFLATAPLSAAIAAANSGSSASTQGGERTRRMTRQDAARKYVLAYIFFCRVHPQLITVVATLQAYVRAYHEPQEHDGIPLSAQQASGLTVRRVTCTICFITSDASQQSATHSFTHAL
ncbi:hypothetical protein ON010_g15200 [Phytophthora cinnamomi]|nr:hypothetical protein ON010_g15200 [Phytophthora cinnamomi]